GDASLILATLDDTPITRWSLTGLRDLGAGEGALSLTPDDDGDERLVLEDPDMVAAIRAVCPDLERRRAVPRSRWRRASLWAAAALGAIYLIIFHIAPALSNQMAKMIPPETEAAMGREMAKQFTSLLSKSEPRFCSGGAGGRALDAMVA